MGNIGVLVVFLIGMFIGLGIGIVCRQPEVRALIRHLEDAERILHEQSIKQQALIDNLMFPDRVEAPLLQQPDTSMPDELLMAYGVTNVSDLPRDVRAVWDKDYNGGGVQ